MNKLTLCNHTRHKAQMAQPRNSSMSNIGPTLTQVMPAQETPSPIPLSRGMRSDEFVIVDGAIGLVECVGALVAPVVCKA
jgi:hypothetical protein